MGRGKFGLQAMQVTDYPKHFDTEVKAQGEAERLSAEYEIVCHGNTQRQGGKLVNATKRFMTACTIRETRLNLKPKKNA